MAPKIIKGSATLGQSIKERRNELSLTIEQASVTAGVGTKTWSRYESGGSIRSDKLKGVLRALKWKSIPGNKSNSTSKREIKNYRNNEAWSDFLFKNYGELAAISFVIGSDILIDDVQYDLDSLSNRPKGTHIGEIENSMLVDLLPPQFLMKYDYDFLYLLKVTIEKVRNIASSGRTLVAHTVLEELVLYLILEESRVLMNALTSTIEGENFERWDEWPFELFDDADIIMFLYSNWYLAEDDTYHFNHWSKAQFFLST